MKTARFEIDLTWQEHVDMLSALDEYRKKIGRNRPDRFESISEIKRKIYYAAATIDRTLWQELENEYHAELGKGSDSQLAYTFTSKDALR